MNNFLKALLLLFLCAGVFFFIIKVSPANSKTPQNDPVQLNPIADAALKKGATVCSGQVDHVAKYLLGNSVAGAFLFFAPNEQKDHIFSASLEVLDKSGNSTYSTVNFTPTPKGTCDAAYDAVQYVSQSCVDVAVKDFKLKGNVPTIKKNIMVLNADKVKLFLMPAGTNGCVLIKKEILE